MYSRPENIRDYGDEACFYCIGIFDFLGWCDGSCSCNGAFREPDGGAYPRGVRDVASGASGFRPYVPGSGCLGGFCEQV